MRVLLKLINGEEIKQTVDNTVCVIGRSSKCDVVVPHEGMSRQHCQLEVIEGEFYVTDLGSTNGVSLEGEKIPPNQKVKYQTFFNLSFGPVQSVQVFPDEGTQTRANIQQAQQALISKVAPLATTQSANATTPVSNTGTKTKSITTPKTSTTPVTAKKNSGDSKSFLIKVLIVVAILSGVAWYYINGEGEVGVQKPANPAEIVE